MIESHFGDIRSLIINELNLAKHDIYVAVAWVTDLKLLELLVSKLYDGIDVKIVLIKDEVNLKNGFDFNEFVRKGGIVYWDNHHHKFCVIDRKVIITGSYNWTYAAHNRSSRENILIIKDEKELIENYSSEFKVLIKQAEKHILPPKEIIKYVEKEVIVEKIIEVKKEKKKRQPSSKKKNDQEFDTNFYALYPERLKPNNVQTEIKNRNSAYFIRGTLYCGNCHISLTKNNTCSKCSKKYNSSGHRI